ncbi:hypothetical protein Agabi119p4_11047 [Agaricus bisporus var. burnettii]|uniref:Uncharacterized protein n=1 Tax=Agaricus bisporus var. burnettii TaxID=192524 RepID=A0A8H7C1P7_AGABI|nr:hypothetical protein Agabi119p4_11047 [Agaricus bisporus var. burnettii]
MTSLLPSKTSLFHFQGFERLQCQWLRHRDRRQEDSRWHKLEVQESPRRRHSTDFLPKFGGGRYNLTAASEYGLKCTQDGIQQNPTFTIVAPRLFSAYSEAVNPINLWVDGRQDDGQLRLDHARIFFEAARYPDDFHRAARPMSADNEAIVLPIHPLEPGTNIAGVNTYTVDRNAPRLDDKCSIFEYHVNHTLRMLYPNPTGNLLDAIRANIHYFYTSVQARGCSEIFPYCRFEDGESNTYYTFPDYPEVEHPEYGTFPYSPVEALTYTDAPAPASTNAVPPAASMTVPVTLSD